MVGSHWFSLNGSYVSWVPGGCLPLTIIWHTRDKSCQKRATFQFNGANKKQKIEGPAGRYRMQLCPLCNTIRVHYCICNNVHRTILHMQSCRRTLLHNAIVSARTHLHMQLCPPHAKLPCSKLNALGRRNTYAIFLQAKCMSSHKWHREMFGRWVFAAIIKIKYVNIHAEIT